LTYAAIDWRFAVQYHNSVALEHAYVTGAVKVDGTPSADDVAHAVAAAFGAEGGFTEYQTVGWDLQQVDVANLLDPTIVGSSDFSDADHDSGQQDNAAVPQHVAFILTLLTGLAGKANRGRWFLPGMSQNLLATGAAQWSSGSQSGMSGFAAATAVALDDDLSGTVFGVNSRSQHLVREVTGFTPRLYFGTQRRRINGRD
jgi:hypothetical protein